MTQTNKTITVTITPGAKIDGPPTVDKQSVTVGKDDEVAWVCSTGCDFSVVFLDPAKKPFKDRGFNQQKSKSGKPTQPPPPNDETYKYSVIVGGGVVDPDVIVKGGG